MRLADESMTPPKSVASVRQIEFATIFFGVHLNRGEMDCLSFQSMAENECSNIDRKWGQQNKGYLERVIRTRYRTGKQQTNGFQTEQTRNDGLLFQPMGKQQPKMINGSIFMNPAVRYRF